MSSKFVADECEKQVFDPSLHKKQEKEGKRRLESEGLRARRNVSAHSTTNKPIQWGKETISSAC